MPFKLELYFPQIFNYEYLPDTTWYRLTSLKHDTGPMIGPVSYFNQAKKYFFGKKKSCFRDVNVSKKKEENTFWARPSNIFIEVVDT